MMMHSSSLPLFFVLILLIGQLQQPVSCLVQQYRLASWNLLAQEYCKPTDYPWSPPEVLEWDHRKTLITSRLNEIDADIICLQEVQVDLWPELYDQFKDRYQGFLQDVGTKHNVATATLIKRQPITTLLPISQEQNQQHMLLSVDRIESRSRALIVVIKEHNNPQHLYVCNVHLEAGMGDINDYHRYCQLKSLFRRLKHHCQKDSTTLEDSRIIMAGDFNMLKMQTMYNCITNGELPNAGSDSQQQQGGGNNNKKGTKRKKKKNNKPKIIKTIPLIDSYGYASSDIPLNDSRQHYPPPKISDDEDDDHASTNIAIREKLVKTYGGGSILDYIWTTRHVHVKDSLLLHPAATMSKAETWPNVNHPSDHLPIGIELEW